MTQILRRLLATIRPTTSELIAGDGGITDWWEILPIVSQPQVELAYSKKQPAGLVESQEFLGQPGQGLVLELRIRVVLNHQQIIGVVQPNVGERSEVAYLLTHRAPDSRTHSDRIAIRPDSSALLGSKDRVLWYFHQR